jgi:shikimate dehydrogenase
VTVRCAVLGRPIAHSLSPVLHRTAYASLGLDWEYDARDVGEDELGGFLDGLDETWRGLSLTMPLKRAVVPLLDTVSARAEQAGAANTVVLDRVGGGARRVGHNTDIPGAAAALRERYDGPLHTAIVLGGGATAASVLLGLADLGCGSATLLVRDEARAADTLAAVARHPVPPRVEVRPLGSDVPPADVLVSTIPAAAPTERELRLASKVQVVFDVLYDPWPTPLAVRARDAGRRLVTGLDLLVHQAALQVELMTGEPAPLAAMRLAGEQAVGR